MQRRIWTSLVRRHSQIQKMAFSTELDESHLDLFSPKGRPIYDKAIEFKTPPKLKNQKIYDASRGKPSREFHRLLRLTQSIFPPHHDSSSSTAEIDGYDYLTGAVARAAAVHVDSLSDEGAKESGYKPTYHTPNVESQRPSSREGFIIHAAGPSGTPVDIDHAPSSSKDQPETLIESEVQEPPQVLVRSMDTDTKTAPFYEHASETAQQFHIHPLPSSKDQPETLIESEAREPPQVVVPMESTIDEPGDTESGQVAKKKRKQQSFCPICLQWRSEFGVHLRNDHESHPEGRPVIECQKPELNHYRNQTYDKKELPLASKGWHHYKSKGDYFTVQVYENAVDLSNYFHGELSAFDGLSLDENIVEALKTIGVHRPTLIQEKSVPVILSGKNTVIAAETGCGKTLAYLVPLIQQVIRWRKSLKDRPPNSPLALIMCPSRELASQIGEIAKKLSTQLPFSCDTLLGGRTKRMMMNPYFRDVDIQISTPGVISKLVTVGLYDLRDVKHVVVDESDTMLDDSFNEILLRLLKKMRISYVNDPRNIGEHGCQLTMVSATMPTSIYSILEGVVEQDSLEKVTSSKLHHVMPHVPQTFYRLGLTQKPGKLLQLARKAVQGNQPTMIFSNKAKTCDWIALMLHENGVPVFNLNGDMPSTMRLGKFEQFKNGEVNVLSCTDIASRGLDTSNVELVINYDFPNYMADYVHRCGRVGRCGSTKDGRIVNFVTYPHEIEIVQKIETAVRTMKDLPNVNANISRLIHYRK